MKRISERCSRPSLFCRDTEVLCGKAWWKCRRLDSYCRMKCLCCSELYSSQVRPVRKMACRAWQSWRSGSHVLNVIRLGSLPHTTAPLPGWLAAAEARLLAKVISPMPCRHVIFSWDMDPAALLLSIQDAVAYCVPTFTVSVNGTTPIFTYCPVGSFSKSVLTSVVAASLTPVCRWCCHIGYSWSRCCRGPAPLPCGSARPWA